MIEMFRRIVPSVPNVFKYSRLFCSCVCGTSSVPGNTQFTILENGLRVATETTNAPLACVSLFIEAGSRFETVCNNGITYFVERMAYKGFNSMNRYRLEEYLLHMGVKMTAHTDRELQVFSAKCLPETVEAVVGVLANIITDLALDPCEIEAEKKSIQLHLTDLENDPKSVLFDYLHQTAFQGTPLAKPVMGTSNNLNSFDKCILSSFLCDHYQPYKLALVSSGLINHESLVNCACSRFGHMVGDACCESEEGPTRFTGSQILFRNDAMPYVHVAIAFEVPGYNHPDFLPLLTAKNMIGTWNKSQGGQFNNGSPLARASSVAELCEYFEAFYIPYRDIGLWGVYYIADTMEADDMIYNIQNIWMDMCIAMQYPEVERGKNVTKFELASQFDGSIRSCSALGHQIMHSCGRQDLSDLYYLLKGINHLNVRSVLDKWLYDRCPAVAAVGPTEGLRDYTRIRAGMYWLRF